MRWISGFLRFPIHSNPGVGSRSSRRPSCGWLSASRYFHEESAAVICFPRLLCQSILKFNSGSLRRCKMLRKGGTKYTILTKTCDHIPRPSAESPHLFSVSHVIATRAWFGQAGVSIDAVFVDGAKAGWWQVCTWTVGTQVIHCRSLEQIGACFWKMKNFFLMTVVRPRQPTS